MLLVSTNADIAANSNRVSTTYVLDPIRLFAADDAQVHRKFCGLMPDIEEKIKEYEHFVFTHPQKASLPIILMRPLSHKDITVLTVLLAPDISQDKDSLMIVMDRILDFMDGGHSVLRLSNNSDVVSAEVWKEFKTTIKERDKHYTNFLEIYE